MSQVFDDLVDQVNSVQSEADDHELRLQTVEDNFTNGIRSQLDYPLDPQSVQEIQEVAVAVGQGTNGQYSSNEFNDGTASSTVTIDWSKGNVQYGVRSEK